MKGSLSRSKMWPKYAKMNQKQGLKSSENENGEGGIAINNDNYQKQLVYF